MSQLVEIETKLPLLAEPFPTNWIKWKPQAVKGNRAMAVAFIDARIVQDRLDEIVGPGNWKDSYSVLPDGLTVHCSLAIRLGTEWVAKEDVGSPSEQPDGGDRVKAAFSDALKRAAVKWGVGRYLYSLPQQWCDYDPMKKQFVAPPRLPDWAIPASEKKQAKQTELKATMSAANMDTSKVIDETQMKKLQDLIKSTNTDLAKFLVHIGASELKVLSQEKFHLALGLLKKKQDALNAQPQAKA